MSRLGALACFASEEAVNASRMDTNEGIEILYLTDAMPWNSSEAVAKMIEAGFDWVFS